MKLIRNIAVAAVVLGMSGTVFAGGTPEAGAAAGGSTLPKTKVELLGAGASFPAPLITAWADDYRDLTKGRVTVNYQSIGSGGGVRQFMEQTIMFGASEAALNDANMELAKKNSGGLAYNLPLTLGDVVLTYNVPGVQTGLVFTPALIADCFLGKITNWNDPKIAAVNPGVKLPSLPINIAHRSDGSGTTSIFTTYLSTVNAEWKTKVGAGSSVNWPVGTGGNGNEGVAGIIQNTPGALGYNSLVYAVLNKISYGYVQNKSGNVIKPSLEATSLAAAVTIPVDGRVSLVDTAAPKGYPIAGFAWGLVYENLDKNAAISSREIAIEVARFLYYVVTTGQDINESLSFARLPKPAQELAISMISTLKFQGENIGEKVIADVKKNGF